MKPDRQLKRDVLDELQYEPSVDASGVGVIVHNGIVTLSGKVATYPELDATTHAVERIAGVQAVVNEIKVDMPTVNQRDDEEIAQAVLNALKWHVWVPHETIKVSVHEGWVTLEGAVDAQFQRESANDAVQYLTGVKGVINLISVKHPAISNSEVKTKIENALRRATESEASHIDVEVEGNKVILRGRVRSWIERSEAERAAWAAPGVGQVEDNLTIAA